MKRVKRLLALCLVFATLVGTLPMTALATETDTDAESPVDAGLSVPAEETETVTQDDVDTPGEPDGSEGNDDADASDVPDATDATDATDAPDVPETVIEIPKPSEEPAGEALNDAKESANASDADGSADAEEPADAPDAEKPEDAQESAEVPAAEAPADADVVENTENAPRKKALARSTAVATNGTVGSNLKWSFQESTGTLTITGKGALTIPDGNYKNTPWYELQDEIRIVVIGDGVTSIGKGVFSWSGKLTTVTIPKTVTKIDEGAFEYCSSLFSLTIPSSVTSIGEGAFSNCSGLAKLTLQTGLVSIGDNAFQYCSALTSLTIPSSVTSIGKEAFYKCTGLKDLQFQKGGASGTTSIGMQAFQNCSGLTSLTIPGSVGSIGDSAFYYCRNLTSVTIQSGVKVIGEFAFWANPNLTSVLLPNSVISIGGDAFNGNYTTLYGNSGSYAQPYADANKIGFGRSDLSTPKLSKVENITSGVKVTWDKVEDAEYYSVYSKTGSGNWTRLGDTESTDFTDKTVKGGTQYTYTVRCVSRDGIINTSGFDSAGKTITFIATPKISSLKPDANGIKVAWGKVAGAEQYRVFVKIDGKWKVVGDTTATSLIASTYDNGGKKVALKNGTELTFTVRCLSGDGKTYTSDYDKTGKSITALPVPKISAIENVAKDVSGIKMNWGKVTGAANYEVYRRKHGSTGWMKLATVDTLTYTDTSVRWMTGTLYDYAIVAVNGNIKSAVSPIKTILRMAAPAITGLTNSTANTIKATWSQNKSADGYQIWYQVGGNASTRKLKTVYGSATLNSTISALTKGNSYKVFVRSFKKVDGVYYYSAWSASKTVTVSK